MPDEQDKSDADIEAEMLRMMAQEAAGGTSDNAEPAPATESADSSEDEMLRMMQQAMAEAQSDTAASEADPNADRMLEMEMLKAMQGDSGESVTAVPFQVFAPPVAERGAPTGLSRLMDVNVKITVELGANQTPIKDILTWGEGTLVALERMDREPVDVLVNDKLFARGEVVVVGETFGIRITELLNGPSRR